MKYSDLKEAPAVFEVWFAQNPLAMIDSTKADSYKSVGVITVPERHRQRGINGALDFIFSELQDNWNDRTNCVCCMPPGPLRSMVVGDLVHPIDSDVVFIAENHGWRTMFRG